MTITRLQLTENEEIACRSNGHRIFWRMRREVQNLFGKVQTGQIREIVAACRQLLETWSGFRRSVWDRTRGTVDWAFCSFQCGGISENGLVSVNQIVRCGCDRSWRIIAEGGYLQKVIVRTGNDRGPVVVEGAFKFIKNGVIFVQITQTWTDVVVDWWTQQGSRIHSHVPQMRMQIVTG